MLSITQLMTQVTVGLQSLTVDSFLSLGLVMYISHKIVSYAYSNSAQFFWILMAVFLFYNVGMGIYPIFSFEFFSAIAIFGTASPVIGRAYRYFVKVKNRVTYIAPETPSYSPRFGYTDDEMLLKKSEDKRENEKHQKQQQYFQKLAKKMDEF